MSRKADAPPPVKINELAIQVAQALTNPAVRPYLLPDLAVRIDAAKTTVNEVFFTVSFSPGLYQPYTNVDYYTVTVVIWDGAGAGDSFSMRMKTTGEECAQSRVLPWRHDPGLSGIQRTFCVRADCYEIIQISPEMPKVVRLLAERDYANNYATVTAKYP